MKTLHIICAQCGERKEKQIAAINRTVKNGGKLFCSRICSGEGKRRGKPKTVITNLARIANNYLSGSKVWSTNGVIMNLELPSMIYRGNV